VSVSWIGDFGVLVMALDELREGVSTRVSVSWIGDLGVLVMAWVYLS
jgi:hypothetical protein